MLQWIATMFLILASHPAAPVEHEIDLSKYFEGFDGCFVMLDVSKNQITRYNTKRCDTRFSPCSTFKIPNSLIGLETGVIPDADHVIKWDGVRRERDALNRDHTLRSAIKHSVVWYYQEVARRVGQERMQKFLDDIPYGNRDTSAGLTEFWLGKSLRISADEQIEFLRRVQCEDSSLPFSERSFGLLKSILIIECEEDGTIYRGKTGSNRGTNGEPDLGWYVGWIERPDGGAFIFACNISGKSAWGTVSRRITEEILTQNALLARP